MISVTPPGKVPLWLRTLLPELTGLKDNPLFIRWSGQGFHRRPRWYKAYAPIELRRAEGRAWDLIGVAGLLLIVLPLMGSVVFTSMVVRTTAPGLAFSSSMILVSAFSGLLIPVGIALLLIRLIGSGSFAAASRLIRNCAGTHWGTDLYLTSLEPIDYDRALFGALILKSARTLAIFFGVLTALLVALIALTNAYLPGSAAGQAGVRWLTLLPASGGTIVLMGVLFAEVFLFIAMRLALSCNQATEAARHGLAGVILNEIVIVAPICAAHSAGFIALFIWVIAVVGPSGLIRAAPWLAAASSALVFTVPSIVLGVLITRRFLRKFEGNLGKAFRLRFERV